MNPSHVLAAFLLAGCFHPAAASAATIAVTSQDDASVSEIDPGTDRVISRVTVSRGPAGLSASGNGNEIFVTHPDGSMIDVIDHASKRVVRSLPYKGEAFGIAAGKGVIYVSDWAKHIITRLDAISGVPIGSVPVGRSPAGVVMDVAHHRLYAADRESGDVAVVDVDAMRMVAAIATGASPFALALSPDGDTLYVANVGSNDLAVIDTTTLRHIATVEAGSMPYGVAVTSDGASILVTNQHGNTLSIIDAKRLKVVAAVPVGRYPEGVIVANGRAYVANWFSGDISVVDLVQRRETTRIKVGDGPRNFTRLSGLSGSP